MAQSDLSPPQLRDSPHVSDLHAGAKDKVGTGTNTGGGKQIVVYESDSYTGSTYQTTYIVGLLFCGAVGLLTFFILLLYLKSRERIYLYYCLFLLFNLIGCIINLRDFTWASSLFYQGSGIAMRYLEVVTLLALYAYCVFTIRLLDIRKQAPRLANWITYLGGITAIYGILYWFLYPFIEDQALMFFIISRSIILPMSLIAILWVVNTVRSMFKNYFIIGSIFYFSGALLGVLRDVVPDLPFSYFYHITSSAYYYSGILLETVCFALALSHRIYLLYKAKQQEQEIINEKAVYEKNLAQAQILASRMQINPHFIFNCLNAIKYLIQSNKNSKATKYLSIFSRFVRIILERGAQPLVSLSEELDIVRDYLVLEANRFEDNFTYTIKIQNDIETDNIFIPPMLLQPFIENAIWHGLLSSQKSMKKLSIDIKKNESSILILIDDNGEGREQSALDLPGKFHKAEGTRINNERIDLHNKTYDGKINYFTENRKDHNGNTVGTRVCLIIDYQNKKPIKV